jgi:hypothetical protein
VLVTIAGAKATLWIAGGVSAAAGLVGLALLPGRRRHVAAEVPEADASTIGSP